MDYSIHNLTFAEREKTDRSDFQRSSFIRTSIILGFKGITEDENLYLITGIVPKFGYRFTPMSAITGGIEFVIDGTEIQLQKRYPEFPKNAAFKTALTAGYEYILGTFSLTFDLGLYVYNSNRRTDLIYQRYGALYKFRDKICLGLNLKAHRHVADFFDVRLGFMF
jgi:hypothetical protein